MVERTGQGDPVRLISLLWGPGLKRGRSGLSVEVVVGTGVALADETGLGEVSMRKIADRLGVAPMTLYSHVPGKAELIDLMVDSVHGEVSYDWVEERDPARWRGAMEEVADANWDLFSRHRWLLDVDTTRPPLGPGTIGKYDAELRALVGTGLDDVQIDQVLDLILGHVRSSARQSFSADDLAARSVESSHADWWSQAGPLLAAVINPERYPTASRIGQAAGEEYDAPSDPRRAYAFGLRTLLDGVEQLIGERG